MKPHLTQILKGVTVNNDGHDLFCSPSIIQDKNGPNYSFGLESRYGSNEDRTELATLLCSWNLGHLYDFFVQQQLFIGILKHVSKTIAENLFVNTDISLGGPMEFFYQWSQWIKSFEKSTTSPCLANEHLQCDKSTQSSEGRGNNLGVISQSSTDNNSQVLVAKTSINLIDIINSNSYGKSMVETYKKQKTMDDNLRKLLVESVLQHCIMNNHDLCVTDCASISRQICEVFPGELPVNNYSYFISKFTFCLVYPYM
ncbi:uncharacterized protein LOC118756207 [Rhagoletis pomonella]|uniref:uncharacterized protein LOC118756207 n=1 Tax=Rhagoletis pomonella TaxID=28610 RepID=UPI0017854626|nr:uncharacterized protein LOC118756207 [Rhagoletis pomonella]